MSSVTEQRYLWRKAKNAIALVLSVAAAIVGLFFLVWILWTTVSYGVASMNIDLFTMMTPPPGERGGLLNAFAGSAVIIALAIGIGAPIGVAAGTYLAEFANYKKIGMVIRFVNDILLSAPSIVLGLFIYTLVVAPLGNFSALAGALALAFVALPVVVRTTDEMLRLVPAQMREAALSLGIPQWKVTMQVLYRAALPGIVTGILLAVARISGETAPLLFTAFGNPFWSMNIFAPMSNMPRVIYDFANNPDPTWNSMAWAGAFVMTAFVLLLSLVARMILLRNKVPND